MNNSNSQTSKLRKEELELFGELIPLRCGGIMIGVPYETMRRYVKLRVIPYYKIGGRLKVNRDEIRDWYHARKVAPLASTELETVDAIRGKTKTNQ